MKLHFTRTLPTVVIVGLLLPFGADALTIRSKGDLRLWQTVLDRSAPLSWDWDAEADSATVTFYNRLTREASTVQVTRVPGALRGECEQPKSSAADEALVATTLIQTADGVEISRSSAELAYVPGAAGSPLTVRTKSSRDWWRVTSRKLSAFDAKWWDVSGPSGYEVLWAKPAGTHTVVRCFDDVGIVDQVKLMFETMGFSLFFQ